MKQKWQEPLFVAWGSACKKITIFQKDIEAHVIGIKEELWFWPCSDYLFVNESCQS